MSNTTPNREKFAALIRRLFWATAAVLGALQAFASRASMTDDAVNFLDIGDHILRGEWTLAVNGMWNPLYATILGVANALFKPSIQWQFPLVHLILYLIFVFSLWCFDWFLSQLILFRQENEGSEELSIPLWVWYVIGYALFLWAALELIRVDETNPDMLVAACFYLACGTLVRIRRGAAGWVTYGALGLVLGLSYLTKAVMFPVSLICLCAAAIIALKQYQLRRMLVALLLFSVLTIPVIAALSSSRGRFTFGESGRYNYALHVNHLPMLHWQGGPSGYGQPIHPTRKLVDQPATFEFAAPLAATYPAWYDVSYWYDGIKPKLDWRTGFENFIKLAIWESGIALEVSGSFAAGVFILFCVSGRHFGLGSSILRHWFLLIPGASALFLYALIYIEPRYLAPFLVLCFLSLFFSVRLPLSTDNRRLCAAVACLILLMFVAPSDRLFDDVAKNIKSSYQSLRNVDPNSYSQIASEWERLGLQPGDSIASLQYPSFGTVQCARLIRLKIVAEVYYWPTLSDTADSNFWNASPADREKVLEAFTKSGAVAAITQIAPPPDSMDGWVHIGNSKYYLYWLGPKRATHTHSI